MSESNGNKVRLIVQRSIGNENHGFRELIKSADLNWKVIGTIRKGNMTREGQSVPVYLLYNQKGQLLASEQNREYLQDQIVPSREKELVQAAQEKWKEAELEKARAEAEPEPEKKATRRNSRTKKQAEVER